LKKSNILFFLTDQHSPRVAGCYGDRYAQTPTLDRLAREGVTFDARSPFQASKIGELAR
jgi:choline-sulfatase